MIRLHSRISVRQFLVAGLMVAATPGLSFAARMPDPLIGVTATDAPNGPWQWTTERPADSWTEIEFDDSRWQTGPGGFGEPSTPGSRVNTEWLTPDIWLRRIVDLDAVPENPALLIHHDEEAEVFINGQKVAAVERWVTEYKVLPLSDDARNALKSGENLLAVHCHQNGGGQFIDVHLIDADTIPELPAPAGKAEPYKTDLITEWGSRVTPENAWREYPRPQLVRSDWTNLNGQWDYAVTPRDQVVPPAEWSGKILVPFAIESRLSGVQKHLQPGEALWYHRSFDVKKSGARRLLLNFEAVDYRCRVTVNGKDAGDHIGGNLPFSLDITEAIRDGKNELIVRVEDSTDGAQLRGKQHLRKMLSMNSSTSWPCSSRKYSAIVTPVRPTRRRAPGGSFIWPNTIVDLASTPDSVISRYRSLPSRVRSPTPANTEKPPCSVAMFRINSWMSTVLPTPAPPTRPILPPRT